MKVDKENIVKGVVTIFDETTIEIDGARIASTTGAHKISIEADRAHAQLFADALEALNRTGLTPSELADSRDKHKAKALQMAYTSEIKEADGFVLPAKWRVELKPKTVKALRAFAEEYNLTLLRPPYSHTKWLYNISDIVEPGDFDFDFEAYEPITFEQFKQHVLKQEPEVKEQPAEFVKGQWYISQNLRYLFEFSGEYDIRNYPKGNGYDETTFITEDTFGWDTMHDFRPATPEEVRLRTGMWEVKEIPAPILSEQEQRFEAVVAARLEAIRELILVKGREYRRNGDVFHNFNAGGKMLGCTPERALLGFAAKHFVSVVDMVNDLDSGKVPAEAVVNEKLGDAMVYLVLLEGLFKERLNTL